MTYKRQYLIQRLYHLLDCNEEFYNTHEELKKHLLDKIHMLELNEELDIEENL